MVDLITATKAAALVAGLAVSVVTCLAKVQDAPVRAQQLRAQPHIKKVHFNLDLTSKGVKIALQPTICLNPQEFVENELNSLLCMVIIEIISGPWDFPIRTAAGGVFFVGFLLVTDFA